MSSPHGLNPSQRRREGSPKSRLRNLGAPDSARLWGDVLLGGGDGHGQGGCDGPLTGKEEEEEGEPIFLPKAPSQRGRSPVSFILLKDSMVTASPSQVRAGEGLRQGSDAAPLPPTLQGWAWLGEVVALSPHLLRFLRRK